MFRQIFVMLYLTVITLLLRAFLSTCFPTLKTQNVCYYAMPPGCLNFIVRSNLLASASQNVSIIRAPKISWVAFQRNLYNYRSCITTGTCCLAKKQIKINKKAETENVVSSQSISSQNRRCIKISRYLRDFELST